MSLTVRLLGRLARSASATGSILCFHGIQGEAEAGRKSMHVTVSRLIELLEVVRAAGVILPLEEIYHRWSIGASTRGCFAITFDDAYLSLLSTAAQWYTPSPCPISVFVVGEASERGATFWWDRLDSLVHVLDGGDWDRLAASCGMDGGWRESGQRRTTEGRAIRDWIVHRCAGRVPNEAEAELGRLEAHHGVRPSQRAMTVEELHHFGTLGPVSFGVHTDRHPALPDLPPAAAVADIRAGWRRLVDWDLPGRVPFLAVPFGLMSQALPALSCEAGMTSLLALDDSRLSPGSLGDANSPLSRLSMIQTITPLRLAYRLTGLREVLAHPAATKQEVA